MSTPLNIEMHLDESGSDPVVIIEGVDISAHINGLSMTYDSEDGCMVSLGLVNVKVNRVPREVPAWMDEEQVEEIEVDDEDAPEA